MRRKDTKKKKTMIQYYDKKNYQSFYISSYLSIWRFIKTMENSENSGNENPYNFL